ncbi:hypothetical protein QQZ08_007633 [Neonectria magnoliae]|uniref:Uncharacterized protein n=1 Tax=Neonectria magnoliae TaxID=2732573 RepID=A0ABR1HXJ2_9HYPO
MRPSLNQLSLDKNGFEVHKLPTSMEHEDFLDYDRVTGVYMKELPTLVKQVCKAKHVYPLNYELRKRHEKIPISIGRDYEFGQLSSITHVDVTVVAIKNIIRGLYGKAAETILQTRIQCVTQVPKYG